MQDLMNETHACIHRPSIKHRTIIRFEQENGVFWLLNEFLFPQVATASGVFFFWILGSHSLSKTQVWSSSTTTEVLIEKQNLACTIKDLNRMPYAGFGLHKVIHDGNIITTLTISLVWIFYSLIPPYLLVHYHFIGKGQTLRWASKLCYMLSFFCSVAAIILIWLVYPRGVRNLCFKLSPSKYWKK